MMTRFAPLLVAVALLATACGGGGESTQLAADQLPTPVPIAEGDFDFVDEVRSGRAVAEDEVVEPEAILEAAAVSYEFDTPLDRAMTLVLTPADIAADYPGLTLDPVHTDEVTHLEDLEKLLVRSDAAVRIADAALAGYRSLLVVQPKTEAFADVGGAVLVSGQPNPHIGVIATEVRIFGSAEEAANRVALERGIVEELIGAPGVQATVGDVAALPGEAFSASLLYDAPDDAADLPTSVVWFAQGEVAASVETLGTYSAADAVEIAQRLGLRIHRVGEGTVPVRDPYPYAGRYHLAHRELERFRAESSVIVRDEDGQRIAWSRASGVYAGRDDFSCQVVAGEPGTERMVVDLTVRGDDAQYRAPESFALVEVGADDPYVIDNLSLCPTSAAHWQDVIVRDLSALEADRGATPVGMATSYRTEDGASLQYALGVSATAATDLVRYTDFVHDEGWLAGTDFSIWLDRGFAEELIGVSLAGHDRVLYEYHYDVVEAGGEELAVEPLATFAGMAALEIEEG